MNKELLLNLSFPLCPRLCDYCNYRPLQSSPGARAAYCTALQSEIEAAAPDFSDCRIQAIWLGGGMPGSMSGDQLRQLLRTIKRGFAIAPNVEFSVELTPDYTTVDFLSSMDSAFRLRPSFSFISAVPEELLALGCYFNYNTYLDELELLQIRRIKDFSLDLHFGLFKQTPKSLIHSLQQAIRLDAPHIGLSPFRLHPDSVCAKMVREGKLPPPQTEAYDKLYAVGRDYLKSEGYQPYSLYRFAREGHASAYWTGYLDGADILGLGLGSQSCFEDLCTINTTDFKKYVEHPEDPAVTCAQSLLRDTRTRALDHAFRSLQRPEGFKDVDFSARFGSPFAAMFPETYCALLETGCLREDTEAGCLLVTDWGSADFECRVAPILLGTGG